MSSGLVLVLHVVTSSITDGRVRGAGNALLALGSESSDGGMGEANGDGINKEGGKGCLAHSTEGEESLRKLGGLVRSPLLYI